jgi:hypothetical protein
MYSDGKTTDLINGSKWLITCIYNDAAPLITCIYNDAPPWIFNLMRRPEFLMMRRPCAALRRPENPARSASILLLVSPSDEIILQLSNYVCHLYGYEHQSDVNLVRYLPFKAGKYEEEMLSLNEDSVLLHIYRRDLPMLYLEKCYTTHS